MRQLLLQDHVALLAVMRLLERVLLFFLKVEVPAVPRDGVSPASQAGCVPELLVENFGAAASASGGHKSVSRSRAAKRTSTCTCRQPVSLPSASASRATAGLL